MKIAKKTKKYILFAVISLFVIAGIVLAIVLPIVLNKTDNVGYSCEQETMPIEYPPVDTIIFKQKISDVLREKLFIIDNKSHTGVFLLDILSKARIPTEKLNLFANYVGEFIEIMITSGLDFDQDDNQFTLFKGLDYHLKMFYEKTQFTELELARFIYELLGEITADTLIKDIITDLGQADFVILFSNSIFTFNMLNDIGHSFSPTEARIFQGVIYSLGVDYLTVIDKLGFKNIERLMGFNFDIEMEDTKMDEAQWQIYSETMEMTKNKAANLLQILSYSMTQTSAYGFELLSKYFSFEDKTSLEASQYLILSHIEIAKAINMGIEKSFDNVEITGIGDKEELRKTYSQLIKQYKIYMDMLYEKEPVDYDEFEDKAFINIGKFLNNIDFLISQKDIDFESMTEQDYIELLQAAQGLGCLSEGMEEFYDELLTTMFSNFIYNFINLDSLVENNKKALEDIIRDTIGKIMDRKDMEDYLEFNH